MVRPKPMSAVRLDTALAVASFCVLDAKNNGLRFRLLPEEIQQLSEAFAPNVPHVLSEEFGDAPVVLRIRLAAAGKPKVVRDKAFETLSKMAANPEASRWVGSQDFGIALLGHTAERVSQLKASVAADSRFNDLRCIVGLGATAETLAQVVRGRRTLG